MEAFAAMTSGGMPVSASAMEGFASGWGVRGAGLHLCRTISARPCLFPVQ